MNKEESKTKIKEIFQNIKEGKEDYIFEDHYYKWGKIEKEICRIIDNLEIEKTNNIKVNNIEKKKYDIKKYKIGDVIKTKDKYLGQIIGIKERNNTLCFYIELTRFSEEGEVNEQRWYLGSEITYIE